MKPVLIERNHNNKPFPKLILRHKETKEEFKLIGGIEIEGISKLVIENEEKKIICTFDSLKEKYWKIGTYE